MLVAVLTACNSNDDGGLTGIEIPGITITDDADCCSAEEALYTYKFLQGVITCMYIQRLAVCTRATTTYILWQPRRRQVTM